MSPSARLCQLCLSGLPILTLSTLQAYTNPWDDITRQFTSHLLSVVLLHAVTTICYLMDTTSLSNAINMKIFEPEDKLAMYLGDAVMCCNVLGIASLTEDEVLRLGAICAHLSMLAGAWDMSVWMEEDEGGKQSSAWDIASALLDCGRLGTMRKKWCLQDRSQSLVPLLSTYVFFVE